MKKDKRWLLPLMFSCSMVVGLIIGGYFGGFSSHHYKDSEKIDEVLNLIRSKYVDSLSMDTIEEDIIPILMSKLDPHSVYIPKEDLQAANEDLEGSFGGIGIQFSILNDTINVIDVISGGPSQKVGIIQGDQIVMINDTLFVGKGINNEKVFKKLRGKEGSSVKIGIKRSTSKSILTYTIRRGVIPVNSVDGYFKLKNGIGYVKVSKFGAKTYDEFLNALAALRKENCNKFIIDLRGNAGGYMDAAIQMINEFLPRRSMIVYAQGNAYPRQESFANGMGSFQQSQIAVLIDEWSASASEIFAGAIQDNDRGTIIGRRSYGKGLVQEQIPLFDGSAIRLTVARYYIPSGRCIQKEYLRGDNGTYAEDIINRYNHGEFFNKDSIKFNPNLEFKTSKGRPVFGGGGIMPDIFVPRDTTGLTSYFNQLINKSIIYTYSFEFAKKHKSEFSKMNTIEEINEAFRQINFVEEIVLYAEQRGIRRRPYLIRESYKLIESQIHAYIIRNIKGDNMFYESLFLNDPIMSKTTSIFE